MMNDMQEVEQIQRDIEDTRQRIASEIQSVEEKLTPAHAKEVVREKLHEGLDRVTTSAEHATHVARDALRIASASSRATRAELLRIVEDWARKNAPIAAQMGQRTLRTLKRSPIALSVLGIGALWLAYSAMQKRRHRSLHSTRLLRA